MNENTPQPDETSPPVPEGAKRPYWIDEDGNVHGLVYTMHIDHFVEFTDQAIDLTPRAKDAPDA